MKKFVYFLVAVILILIIGILVYKSSKAKTSTDSPSNDTPATTTNSNSGSSSLVSGDIIMKDAIATVYYGDGCPHCTNMEKWLQDNKYLPSGSKIDQALVDSWITSAKVKFNIKEVWKNNANSAELTSNATKLGLSSQQIGVPFLYDPINNKSYIGETDIQTFFQSK